MKKTVYSGNLQQEDFLTTFRICDNFGFKTIQKYNPNNMRTCQMNNNKIIKEKQ